MQQQEIAIGGVPAVLWGEPAKRGFLFVHGQGGSRLEGGAFASRAEAAGWQVLSLDLPGHGLRQGTGEELTPGAAAPELRRAMAFARERWEEVSLRATSIGAYCSMLAFQDAPPAESLFLSPVVDMEALILRMMAWAGVDEPRLEREKEIPTDFGQTLSWRYLTCVREHPIRRWPGPTAVLWAEGDELIPREDIDGFRRRFPCRLTVYPGGEHWFHTPEQLAVVEEWERKALGL